MNYIYGLIDPTTNEIRYVGKTNQKLSWIKGLMNQSLTPIIVCLEKCDKNWQEREKHWISQFKNLTNTAKGGLGGGCIGRILSDDTKKKISSSVKANSERGIKISKAMKGKPKSARHRNNTREGIIKLQGRPVLQYDKEVKLIRRWRSISEAADYYKVDRSSVMRACQGKFKTSAGFVWAYEDIVHINNESVE